MLFKMIIGIVFRGASVWALFSLSAGQWFMTDVLRTILLFYLPIMVFMCFLYLFDKKLFVRRNKRIEAESDQRVISFLGALVLCVSVVISGISYRFDAGLMHGPFHLVSILLYCLGGALFAYVCISNPHAGSTIGVDEDHSIVTSGPYSVVRHPMYLASILLYSSLFIGFGSWLSILNNLLLFPILVIRIKKEESFLEQNATGYVEYEKKVKYRLMPLIW